MKTKVLFYCTKGTPKTQLVKYKNKCELCYRSKYENDVKNSRLNGKIVCECEVECEEIFGSLIYSTDTLSAIELEKKSCLSQHRLFDYLKRKAVGYALHISNLKVFDKPLELWELKRMTCVKCLTYTIACNNCIANKRITNAPQSMMNCFYNNEPYVLISIRPEWLCKILNGEKTIEVRKKILKGMM